MVPPSRPTGTSTRRPTAMSTKTPGAGGRKPREPPRITPPRHPAPLNRRGGEARRNPAHRPGEAEAEAAGGNPGQRVPGVRTAAAAGAAGEHAKQPRIVFVTQSRRSALRRPNILEGSDVAQAPQI